MVILPISFLNCVMVPRPNQRSSSRLTRRSFLTILGVGGVGTVTAGYLKFDDDLREVRNNFLGYSEGGYHEFGFFKSTFESVDWKADGTLVVSFSDSQELNSIALYEPNQKAPNFAFAEEPPDDNRIEVEILDPSSSVTAIRTGTWRIVGYELPPSELSQTSQELLDDATIETATFDVEPELKIVGGGVNEETGEATVKIENTGNAPAPLYSVRVASRENERQLTGIVPQGESKSVEIPGKPFEDDGCVEIPPFFKVEVRGATNISASEIVDTPYNEPKRRCGTEA